MDFNINNNQHFKYQNNNQNNLSENINRSDFINALFEKKEEDSEKFSKEKLGEIYDIVSNFGTENLKDQEAINDFLNNLE